MSFRLCSVFAAVALFLGGQPLHQEQPSSASEVKIVMTTVGVNQDPIRMYALRIDKDWTNDVIHLSGKVRIVLGKMAKPGIRPVIIMADQATVNERTGEVVPNGHVRIAPYVNH